MSDVERIAFMEMENMRLVEENRKLHQTVKQLNQTLNRLIKRYISSERIA